MGARIKYRMERGNTVPYPLLFDDVRRNHGFVDTRGRPELVAQIPEAQESAALAALLTKLAQPDSVLVSLGCDLGQHEEPRARLEARRVAGGYIQLIAQRWRDYEFKFLQSGAKAIGDGLKISAGADRWEVDVCLAPVLFKVEEEVEIQSIWLWFFAKGSTNDRAAASRERLISPMEQIIATLGG